MIAKPKICIVTSSRADFGLLSPLIKMIDEDLDLDLQLIVTGSHLNKDHGYTITDVEALRLKIHSSIDIKTNNTSKIGIGQTIARAINFFTSELDRLSPDLVVILGDRYEMLGVATAVTALNIPLAHIHGGEVTTGAVDDSIRHAITKMAHIHFVCAEVYRQRVIQLGENPSSVFNTGALGIDNIKSMALMTRDELIDNLNINLNKPLLMVSYHSVTLNSDFIQECDHMINDLAKCVDNEIIITMPNADFGGIEIREKLNDFSKGRRHVHVYENLGTVKYLSCLSQASILVGNSSSGILEAPFLGCYTINIGSRQDGRLRANSVFDIEAKPNAIFTKIQQLNNEIYQFGRPEAEHIFGDGEAAKKIIKIIKEKVLHIKIKKVFYDLPNFP